MCLTVHLFSGGVGFNIRPCEGHHNFAKDRQKPEGKAGCAGKVGEQKLVQLDREADKRRDRQARTKASARKNLMNFVAARRQCPYLSRQGRLFRLCGSALHRAKMAPFFAGVDNTLHPRCAAAQGFDPPETAQ